RRADGVVDEAGGHGIPFRFDATRRQRPLTVPKSLAIGASVRGRAATQAAAITTSDAANIQNPVQLSANATPSTEPCAAYMWLRFRSAPVASTSATWMKMNTTKYSITGKWMRRAHSTGYACVRRALSLGHRPLIR